MIKESIQQFRAKRKQEARLGGIQETKTRMGLASRQANQTSQDMRAAARTAKQPAEGAYDPAEKIRGWYEEIEAIKAERASREESTTGAASEEMRPERRYETEFRGVVEPPEEIKADPEFTSAVSNLAGKYNISESEVYAVIQGESAFNPQATNPSGASGLFQFMPDTARELGTSTEAILAMTPTEQVAVYDQYLSKWNYNGENRLGIMQAAPAFAGRGPDEVIYAEGTAAWEQNPGWREMGGGPITVKSINNYYAKRANT
jgi:hypothetical protein